MSYSPPKPSNLEKNWLQGCAVSWLVVAAPLLLNPSEVALHVFALDVAGTYGVQQPAAGFLQLAATLMPLEAALLQLLASSTLDEAAVETRARLSASVVLAAGGALALGFGLVWLLVEEPTQADVSAWCDPRGCGVAVRGPL
jgi:hypothetical protein